MVEQRIALAQPQLPRLDRQKLFAIANNLSGIRVKHGQRGCVITGIYAQGQHDASGSAPCSRATAPSKPLTNW